MPAATHETYTAMLNRAQAEGYALPAINVLQIDTLNAAIEGFAEAESDGIIQISVAAGACTSGSLNDSVAGAITLAEHARRIAEKYDVTIAVHTDHCPTAKIETFLKPLIEETAKRRAAGLPNLFNSHMYDGSDLPLAENLKNALPLLEACRDNDIILEVEAGVVGGEEDGNNQEGAPSEKLFTTQEDMLQVHETLSTVENARFMFAATFGNVHGVYKPGHVKLKPAILKTGRDALAEKHPGEAFWFVFHGGSGSTLEEIHETIEYGMVKMNIHTDTQYAFTRAVAGFMFRHYDEVLRIDGEVGVKQSYLASTWLEAGRKGMAARVIDACETLRSAGKKIQG
jgi:fructose-bisphosphate aldolase, class II